MEDVEARTSAMDMDDNSGGVEAPIASGILSQRIFQSPIIKWAFPARIRSEEKKDIVLIGENAVTLKEWDAERSSLREITTKSDFDSRIRCAAVLGNQNTIDEQTGNLQHFSSTQGCQNTMSPQILLLSLESSHLAFLTAAEDLEGSISFQVHMRRLPAQRATERVGKHIATDPCSRAVAVAASERQLVLFGLAPPIGSYELAMAKFIRDEVILKVDFSILKMAFLFPPSEDPDRVTLSIIGVANGKGIACIYAWDFRSPLQPYKLQITRHPLGKEHGVPLSLIPLKTAGYFMLVEEQNMFLYFVSTAGSVQQIETSPLDAVELARQPTSFFPGTSCRKPLWVNWARPIRNSEWTHEAVYLGREDGAIKYVELKLKRLAKHLSFDISGHGGNLDGDIDTAFAILNMCQARISQQLGPMEPKTDKLGYPDILIAPGNFSDGGLYEIGSAVADVGSAPLSRSELHRPRLRVALRSWAPFSDLCVLHTESRFANGNSRATTDSHSNGHLQTSPRLFAASSREPGGSIAEVRLGYEVECKLPPELLPTLANHDRDFDLQYCRGIWPIEVPGDGIVVAFSFPWRTVFAYLEAQTHTFAFLDSNDVEIASCEKATLTVGRFYFDNPEMAMEDVRPSLILENVVIHVTSAQIQLIKVGENPNSNTPNLFATLINSWPMENTYLAASQQNGPWLLMVTRVNHEGMSLHISLKRIGLEGSECVLLTVGTPAQFDEEISAVTFLELPLRSTLHGDPMEAQPDVSSIVDYAAVGTSSGSIHLFAIDINQGLQKVVEHGHEDGSSQVGFAAIESIAAIQTDPLVPNSILLLCGSRLGSVLVLDVQLGQKPKIRSSHSLPLGIEAVYVLRNTDRHGSALVRCGANICQIDFVEGNLDDPRMTSLFFTDTLETSFSYGTMDAMCTVPSYYFTGPLSRSVMGVVDGALLVGQVDQHLRHLPIRRQIPGTPSQLLYSKFLKSLIVGSTVTQIHNGKRYAIPTVALLEANVSCTRDVSQNEIDDYDFKRSGFRFNAGEQLSDMIEWLLTKNNRLYQFIVATTIVNTGDGREAGRIVFLRPMPTEDGRKSLQCAFQREERDPIFAICQNDQGSLIYCRGNDLVMRTYDPESKSFDKRTLKSKMASPGIHISACGSTIVVTTQLHSILVFTFGEDGAFAESSWDNQPRAGVSHIVSVGEKPNFTYMASFSNQTPSVTAFQGTTLINPMEARLPCCITRLANLEPRPTWKRPKLASVIDRDILGTATDGSMFAFSLLGHEAFLLLYFVQNLCMQDRRIWPLRTKPLRGIQPSVSDTTRSHIDGDILARLLSRTDARAVLREMLAKEVLGNGIDPSTSVVVDYHSAEQRLATFKDLVDGIVAKENEDNQGWSSGDTIDTALRYMRRVLELPF